MEHPEYPPAAPVRATSLRGLSVYHRQQSVGTALGLVYDHASKTVTHLKLVCRASGDLLAVPLGEIDFEFLPQHELHLRVRRSWQPLPGPHRPVDRLTVKAQGGSGTVFVHDVWFDPHTGEIASYELGLLPRKASSLLSLCVQADQLTFEADQLLASAQLLHALSTAFNVSMGLSSPAGRGFRSAPFS